MNRTTDTTPPPAHDEPNAPTDAPPDAPPRARRGAAGPGSERGRRLQLVLAIAVLVGAAAVGWIVLSTREEPVVQPPVAIAPLVRTLRVEPTDVRFDVASYGTVAARTEAVLGAEVSGRIVWIADAFDEGGFFAAGETLLRIEPRDYELAVVRAEAAVAQAALRLATEEGEARVARAEWDELGEGDPDPLLLREPQLAEARALLAAARAELTQAQLDLERTSVRAPFDGRVLSRDVELGEAVTTTSDIGRLYATDAFEVRLPVPRDELAFLAVPLGRLPELDPARQPRVTLSARLAGRTWSWEGRIARSEGVITERTRMLPLVAVIDAPYAEHADGRPPLVLGLFVDTSIHGRDVRDAIVLPRSAVRRDEVVLVVDDDDRLRLRAIEPLRVERDRVVVGAGLAPGERVCVSVLETAVDGMPVRPVPVDAPDKAPAGPRGADERP